MKLMMMMITVWILTFPLVGCSKQQQKALSSGEWEQKVQKKFDFVDTWATRTGHWIDAELEVRKLESRVRQLKKDDALSQEQADSLQNSLNWIENLQRDSIASGDGIDSSEKSQIIAAVDRVNSKLNGWIAQGEQKSVY